MAHKRRHSHKKRHSKKLKSHFGPGFQAQTSFPNAVAAPYYGYQEPFINASEWWYPVGDGAYQSPAMLQNFASAFGRRKSVRKGRKVSKRTHKKRSFGSRKSRKHTRKGRKGSKRTHKKRSFGRRKSRKGSRKGRKGSRKSRK